MPAGNKRSSLESGINVPEGLLILEKNPTQDMFIPTTPFPLTSFIKDIFLIKIIKK